MLKDGIAYVQAGGGWVNDSTPEVEFQETVNKAKAMLKAMAMAEGFAKRLMALECGDMSALRLSIDLQ